MFVSDCRSSSKSNTAKEGTSLYTYSKTGECVCIPLCYVSVTSIHNRAAVDIHKNTEVWIVSCAIFRCVAKIILHTGKTNITRVTKIETSY